MLDPQCAGQEHHSGRVVDACAEQHLLELGVGRPFVGGEAACRHKVGRQRRIVVGKAQVEKQALAPVALAQRGREVHGQSRLPGAAFHRIHGDDPAVVRRRNLVGSVDQVLDGLPPLLDESLDLGANGRVFSQHCVDVVGKELEQLALLDRRDRGCLRSATFHCAEAEKVTWTQDCDRHAVMRRPRFADLKAPADDDVHPVRHVALLHDLLAARDVARLQLARQPAHVAVWQREEDRDPLQQLQPLLELGGLCHSFSAPMPARNAWISRLKASGVHGLAMNPSQPAARAARS